MVVRSSRAVVSLIGNHSAALAVLFTVTSAADVAVDAVGPDSGSRYECATTSRSAHAASSVTILHAIARLYTPVETPVNATPTLLNTLLRGRGRRGERCHSKIINVLITYR